MLREGSPLGSTLGSVRSSTCPDSEEENDMQRNSSFERDGMEVDGGGSASDGREGVFRKRLVGGGRAGVGKSGVKKMLSKSDRHGAKPKNRAGSAPYSTLGYDSSQNTNYTSHFNSNPNFSSEERDKDKDKERDKEKDHTIRSRSRSKKNMEVQAAAVFGEKAATLGLYA